MGQKVSPIGLRMGINKTWESKWFADNKDFSKFLDNANLDSRQIYFINQIVEYIVQNGMMKVFVFRQVTEYLNTVLF